MRMLRDGSGGLLPTITCLVHYRLEVVSMEWTAATLLGLIMNPTHPLFPWELILVALRQELA